MIMPYSLIGERAGGRTYKLISRKGVGASPTGAQTLKFFIRLR